MRLGILSNNFPPEIIGGAEICAKQLSDEISKEHDLFVFAGKYDMTKRHSSYNIERHDDVYRTYRINLGYFALDYRNPLNFFDPIIETTFSKLLNLEKPEIIHAHNLAGISLSPIAYAKKKMKIPIVMTLHDFWLICPKNTLLTNMGDLCSNGGINGCDGCNLYFISPLSRITMDVRNKITYELSKHIDMFISPSEILKDIFQQCGFETDIECIKNGLELKEYLSISRDNYSRNKIKILMLGNIAYHKGVYVLLDAIERLVGRGYINIELMLAGSIEDETKLKKEISRLKIEGFVNIIGKISEEAKIHLFKESDVFVLPSLWYENQPLTIIEAMASGLPVIGSNVGGIPEMIIDGKTGYLFRRGDGDDLSAKLEVLISDPEKRKTFGDSARNISYEKYDIHQNTRHILKLYGKLI
jgi:glycosyltransferase involved in cell wall biosynthesis